MSFLVTSAFCGAFAASAGTLFGAEGKEAVGFDEVLPEEPRKEERPAEPRVVEPAVEEPSPPETREEVTVAPPPRRGLNLAIEAGGFFPVKGSRTEYDLTYSLGARACKKLNPRMGLVLSFDYARPESDRGTSEFFLLQAGVRLRLVGEDVLTCPLYAGLAAGLAAEDVTDKYLGHLPGNIGPTISMRLGLRLGWNLDVGFGYVLLPGENSPGAGIVSAGYSF